LTASLLALPFLLFLAPQQSPSKDLQVLKTRVLGPAVMGGRVIDLAVNENQPSTFFVATSSGGVWKTTNNGTTFQPLFQHEKVVSLGSIAIAKRNPNLLWVGTGEANNRNSTPYGGGVYKSEDGGKTWKCMGLEKSYHVGRIAIDPKDPDTVFVAAGGSLWGPGGQRGLYRTQDGGQSWKLVLKHDDKTGATEVRIDPKNPAIIYAALYERQRDGHDTNDPKKRWGPGSGIFRSRDGGDTWKKLTKGLPTRPMGRVSMDIYRRNPKVVYALIETDWVGTRPPGAPAAKQPTGGPAYFGVSGIQDGDGGALLPGIVAGSPAAKAGLKDGDLLLKMGDAQILNGGDLTAALAKAKAGDKRKLRVQRGDDFVTLNIILGTNPQARARGGRNGGIPDRLHGQNANVGKLQGPKGFETGGLFRTEDGGESWARVNSINPRPYYFSQVRVDPSDDNHIFVLGISLHSTKNRGKTFQVIGRKVHPDHHAMWINPRNGQHNVLGCDGGVGVTYDYGVSYEMFDNISIGQCYHAVADTRRPYWVYAGYQDNGSWGSPSETNIREGILSEHFFKIGGGDGFVCRVDPEDPNVVYSESQGGNIGWINVITGARGRISKPRQQRTARPAAEPAKGSGANARGQAGRAEGTPGRAQAAQGRTQGAQGRTQGAQGRAQGTQGRAQGGRRPQTRRVSRYRSNWDTPFLLSKYNPKTIYFAGNFVFKSTNRGRHTVEISPDLSFGKQTSATELAESPRQAGELWVGTNEGGIWVTRNDGKEWTELHTLLTKQHPEAHSEQGRAMWVSSFSPSHHKNGRCYLTLDAHRLDNRKPLVYVTEDHGKTWKSISKGLPEQCVHALREDSKNPDLLYLGNETGLHISIDRGQSWIRMGAPFPTVAVRDFDIQEREQHLIVATHGRSIWTVDVRPLRSLTASARKSGLLLVDPADVLRLPTRSAGKLGHRYAAVPNPPKVASIYWWSAKGDKAKVRISVQNAQGKVLYTKAQDAKAGLHRLDWNLRAASTRSSGRASIARFARRRSAAVPAGDYVAILELGDKRLVQGFKVEDDDRPLDTAWPRTKGVGEGGAPVVDAADLLDLNQEEDGNDEGEGEESNEGNNEERREIR
jgi:photosystem II stability/assembly factor-like uncharacterized protein